MGHSTDLMVFGTGEFAERLLGDLALTCYEPLKVLIAGRNRERLAILVTSSNARAQMFDRPVRFAAVESDFQDPEALVRLLDSAHPQLVIQTASHQSSRVLTEGPDPLKALVRKAGFATTAAINALLSLQIGAAVRDSGINAAFVNCCFPDVVNRLLISNGVPVLCGIGNIAILSNAFSSILNDPARRLRVLAHFSNLGDFRLPPEQRNGRPPRVWIDEDEIDDVFARFKMVRLSPKPAIEISGVSGVPMILAYVTGQKWTGHVPSPFGLPGGYPVSLVNRQLKLDLPDGMSKIDAITWNGGFNSEDGLSIDENGFVHFHKGLYEAFAEVGFPYAKGFHVSQLEQAALAQIELRARL